MRASPIHGLDHIGITVPDIDAATAFFESAFDAEFIYDSLPGSSPPQEGDETETTLNLPKGAKVNKVRMIRLRNGPGIELFEMSGAEQREAVRPSDYGLQHFAVYVDDMAAATAQFEKAGGMLCSPPQKLIFDAEAGEGNLFCYGKTPWGAMIELVTYPSPMPYEATTPLRRWRL